ncbi:MAG: fatty acid desaturase [Acidimicrobiia bacterium]|nr:fatty acid desaturase [Acidimicrobiia bacterium]
MIANLAIALLIGLTITLIANLATSVYLHRSLSHRALELRQPLPIFFRVTLWLTTGIRPRQWVAVHRKHHAFTDEEGDPHSPIVLGWVRVQLTNVALYRRVANDDVAVRRYAKDFPQTPLDRALLDRALVGLGAGLGLLILLLSIVFDFPFWVPLVAAAFHLVAYLGLSGAVNAIGHTFGRRRYQNTATNLQWLAWLTFGEGLHNNHHAAPTSARFSLRRWEIDPGWMFIWLAKSVRLAKLRHESTKFAAATGQRI